MQDPIQKITKANKGLEAYMAQVIECLSNMPEALSLNPVLSEINKYK
jgi:hypothetical protein